MHSAIKGGIGVTTMQDNRVPHDPVPSTPRGKRRNNPRPSENLRYANTVNRRNRSK